MSAAESEPRQAETGSGRSDGAGAGFDGAIRTRLPILCVVTDVEVAGGSVPRLVAAVRSAVAGGVNMVQVRWRDVAEERYRELLRSVVDAVGGDALVIANLSEMPLDRLDARGVDGCHLPEARVGELAEARAAFDERALLGASVHSVAAAESAATGRADYLMVGTLFPTASHPDARPAGTQLVADGARLVSVPLIGIGGIGEDSAGAVIRAGGSGVAVIRGVLAARDPRDAAARLSDRVQEAWESSADG